MRTKGEAGYYLELLLRLQDAVAEMSRAPDERGRRADLDLQFLAWDIGTLDAAAKMLVEYRYVHLTCKAGIGADHVGQGGQEGLTAA